MTFGMILLMVVAVLIFLGFAQRILDRLRLSDRAALLFIAAMLIGTFLPDIPLSPNLSINIGGGVIPIILVGYLFWAAGTNMEKTRAALALVITAILVYGLLKIMPLEPTYAVLIDPLYASAIVAGIVGYLAGRSRRSAFIAGVGGIVLNDIFTRLELMMAGTLEPLVIGGAGIFDATIISGLIAVGLAELVGETRERLQGGPANLKSRHEKDDELNNVEMAEELKPPVELRPLEPDENEASFFSDESWEGNQEGNEHEHDHEHNE